MDGGTYNVWIYSYIMLIKLDQDVNPLPEVDKATLRAQLVPAMVALTMPTDKPIRAQIGEAVALVAELDFPNQWPDLITVSTNVDATTFGRTNYSQTLLAHISPTDQAATLSVLLTSHSIFAAWRSATASDGLFTEMLLVLNSYLDPFMQLFRMTANRLLTAPADSSAPEKAELETIAQSQAVLIDILYDFTCHEWPDIMEDLKGEFMQPGQGWLHRLLLWSHPQLEGEV
jgi:exportin-2 (importin alpha re-exporter)